MIRSRSRADRPAATWRLTAWVAAGAFVAACSAGAATRAGESIAPSAAATTFRAGLDTLDVAWQQLGICAARRDRACAATTFRAARHAYKSHEALLELLAPVAAASLNGRRQEIDDDDAAPPGPAASSFSAVESALPFLGVPPAAAAPIDWSAADTAVHHAHATLTTLRRQSAEFRISPSVVMYAARLEIARVVALGVTGFDAPVTRAGVVESAIALRGVSHLVRDVLPSATPALAAAAAGIDSAAAYLDGHSDFDQLDRIAFVVRAAEPALAALADARRAANIADVVTPRAWVGATLFAADAFDARAYAPSYAPPSSPALVALGAQLFVDPRLSGPGTRSCASCHQPARAFADGRRASLSLGTSSGTSLDRLRNTPSLLSAAYEPALFADARAVTLEDQAGAVLASPREMAGSAEHAAIALGTMPAYRAAFAHAFGDARGVTPTAVRIALAAYVRSLGRRTSRVDLAFRGDTLALSPEERRGASLFLGRAGCGTCHYAPLFAGATPPLFRSIDAEVLGVPAAGVGRRLDDDPGRGAVDGRPEHLHAFKTPTIRNVALTAPYMHDGALPTLDAVVAFYDSGGGQGIGLHVPNQTLPTRPLGLTAPDRRALVAFMRALTDTALERSR